MFLQVPFGKCLLGSKRHNVCLNNPGHRVSPDGVNKPMFYNFGPFVLFTTVLNIDFVYKMRRVGWGNFSAILVSVYLAGRINTSYL